MRIESFIVGIAGANCYIIINEETNEAVVVDPGGTSQKLRAFIAESKIKLQAILLTHAHFDHIMGIPEIQAAASVPVYVAAADAPVLADPDANASKSFLAEGFAYHGGTAVADNQVLVLAGFAFQVLYTPGHTEGSCCYYLAREGVLFSGDTLFRESVGRTDLPGGSDKIFPSIRERLLTLPAATVVYPGHMAVTTIAHEQEYNPFIR